MTSIPTATNRGRCEDLWCVSVLFMQSGRGDSFHGVAPADSAYRTGRCDCGIRLFADQSEGHSKGYYAKTALVGSHLWLENLELCLFCFLAARSPCRRIEQFCSFLRMWSMGRPTKTITIDRIHRWVMTMNQAWKDMSNQKILSCLSFLSTTLLDKKCYDGPTKFQFEQINIT